jgi:hypothetical protein
MKITLAVPEEHNRSNHPVECYPCGRRFVVGSVVALRFSNDDSPICGEVCPKCLAAGPEGCVRILCAARNGHDRKPTLLRRWPTRKSRHLRQRT